MEKIVSVLFSALLDVSAAIAESLYGISNRDKIVRKMTAVLDKFSAITVAP